MKYSRDAIEMLRVLDSNLPVVEKNVYSVMVFILRIV